MKALKVLITLFLIFATLYPPITGMDLSGELVSGWALCVILLPFCLYDVIFTKD